jgi:hypothetical protein
MQDVSTDRGRLPVEHPANRDQHLLQAKLPLGF